MTINSINPELKRALAILRRDPNNVGAHIQAGVYYSQEKGYKKSIFHLKKALAGDKKNQLILEKLSDVLIKTHQFTQAKKYARKMVELKKRDATAMHTLSRAYEASGEQEKAFTWIRKALEQEPSNKDILVNYASYLSQVGKMEESLKVHQQILKIDPLDSYSWLDIAQLQKHHGEEAVATIEKLSEAAKQTTESGKLRSFGFAAGKIHQDIGNYDAAFKCFIKANLQHDKQITADRIIAANINIRETFTREFLESNRESSERTVSPIFILGQTRSGTTLTESLCASHSGVSAGGELEYLTEFDYGLEIFSTFENRYRNNIHGLSANDLSKLANDYITFSSNLSVPNKRLTDKMPNNFLHIGLINLLFPKAQIIHCRRHPLDNCLSIFSNPMLDYHKEYKSTLETLGEYFRNYQQIMDYWKEVSPIPIHDVYYEDLVTNTETVARQMIEHLGLDWEDNVMERKGSQKSVKTLSVWQVRQPVFQSSRGKWRNYEKQLQPLRKILASEIETYERELASLDAQ